MRFKGALEAGERLHLILCALACVIAADGWRFKHQTLARFYCFRLQNVHIFLLTGVGSIMTKEATRRRECGYHIALTSREFH